MCMCVYQTNTMSLCVWEPNEFQTQQERNDLIKRVWKCTRNVYVCVYITYIDPNRWFLLVCMTFFGLTWPIRATSAISCFFSSIRSLFMDRVLAIVYLGATIHIQDTHIHTQQEILLSTSFVVEVHLLLSSLVLLYYKLYTKEK